nr:hypothetical protein [Tanacetum cinerariifolium]
MASLADKAILLGAENRPPMLEKDLYDSWRSRMELYMLNRQHDRMILKSVEHGPLPWPSVTEDGVTMLKKYSKLSSAEATQADCDVKATNIILQALPPEIYALVSTQKVAKELWERIQMLMQGTSLTKQERECKLYDAFDKFEYQKGETLPKAIKSQMSKSRDQMCKFLKVTRGTEVAKLSKFKDLYDSWRSRMEFYMLNRQHDRMILESVEHGPLPWPSVTEDGVTMLKKYSELSSAEATQADCDVKATNIILQALPPKIYALERECKLNDAFDKFGYQKGETLRDFYLRFSLLLNDMNMYNMKLEQFQVNTKFLNTLPPE